MPRRLNLPDSASVATPGEDGRLHAPSAERNAGPITDLLRDVAPPRGRALEIASGTGQHIVSFARALPDLTWQPSEIDPARMASINAWAASAALPNLMPAQHLDATAPDWHSVQSGQTLIVVVNLLHLISDTETRTLLHEASMALVPGGRLVVYGPFLRDGETTSEGDARFHANLRAKDPAIGYKDDFDVVDHLQGNGLSMVEVVEMPANNLAMIAERR